MWTLRRRGGGEREGDLGADFTFQFFAKIHLLAYKLVILRELQDSESRNPQAVFRG